jgi:hypothetical protein
MASKAAKLKHKRIIRGRPCKPDVARNDNGRTSRSTRPAEAPDKLGKETRMRLHGVSAENANQPEAATVIGRLYLSREITKAQYEALVRYFTARARYMLAIMAPDSLRSKGGAGAGISVDEGDEAAMSSWKKIITAVREAQNYSSGNLYAALEYLVVKDESFPHMVGDLRVSANALCRHFGIDMRSD